jgi:DNA-binding phage protein
MAADRRSGAEKHLAGRMKDPIYRAAYRSARRRVAQVDALVKALDERREQLGLTKADLARRADLAPEAVRRLFSVDAPNPTISTLIALADALDLEVMPRPRRATSPPKQSRAKEPAQTRRRG